MTDHPKENHLEPTSIGISTSFKIELDQYNSAFGISAETLFLLAASYNVTPETLINRAVTMWAQAVIPGLDLDTPYLIPEQIKFLEQPRQLADVKTFQPLQTLAEAFKKLLEGKETNHENAESSPRNGGHP